MEYFFNQILTKDIIAIKLSFQKKVHFITLNPDDDTLEIAKEDLENILNEEGCKHIDVSNKMPWQLVINSDTRWVWMLINQQNYLDGLQFEFFNKITKQVITIQMIAIASRIDIKSLH